MPLNKPKQAIVPDQGLATLGATILSFIDTLCHDKANQSND